MSDYVDERDRNYYVAGTRIGLDSIVYSVWEGQSPERILQSFPGVGSVETMRGVIAFYQANKEKIDAWMEEGERIWRGSCGQAGCQPRSGTGEVEEHKEGCHGPACELGSSGMRISIRVS